MRLQTIGRCLQKNQERRTCSNRRAIKRIQLGPKQSVINSQSLKSEIIYVSFCNCMAVFLLLNTASTVVISYPLDHSFFYLLLPN